MQVGDDGGHRIFPLEPERQIDHDAKHHHGQCFQAVLCQLFAHLGADKFGAAQRCITIGNFQRGHHGIALLGGTDALLRRQADHHVTRGAKILHLHIVQAQTGHGAPNLADIGGLGVVDLHQRAAGELNRQVQAACEQEKHRQCKSDKTDSVKDQGVPHKRNVTPDFEKFHLGSSEISSGRKDHYLLGECAV